MSEPTTRQKALAAQVILPMTRLDETPDRCPAWIESRSARCSKPATDGLLATRQDVTLTVQPNGQYIRGQIRAVDTQVVSR